jgi:hypothetical protein
MPIHCPKQSKPSSCAVQRSTELVKHDSNRALLLIPCAFANVKKHRFKKYIFEGLVTCFLVNLGASRMPKAHIAAM